MSKRRYINTKFWDDNYILKLDPTEKLLFLYFLTNPLTNIAGIYEIALRRISFDTGIDSDMIQNIIQRFSNDKKIFYVDGWMIICNFPKHQDSINSPKIQQGMCLILDELPDNIKNSIDTLSIPYLYPVKYSNPNPNTNYNREKIYPIGDKSPTLQKLLEPFKAQYQNIMEEFLNHWTAKNLNGKKELWQMQRVFDVPKRLATWQRNNEKWDKTPQYSSKEEQIAYECAKKSNGDGDKALWAFTGRLTKELGYTMNDADQKALTFISILKF